MPNDDDFLQHLKEIFLIEMNEHVEGMTALLITFEKSSDPAERDDLLDKIMREAHSLKGAARAVERRDIETVCQLYESQIGEMKKKHCEITSQDLDLLLSAVDGLKELEQGENSSTHERIMDMLTTLQTLLDDRTDGSGSGETAEKPEVKQKKKVKPKKPQKPAPEPEAQPEIRDPVPDFFPVKGSSITAESVRVKASKISSVILDAEEMISLKLSVDAISGSMKETGKQLQEWSHEWDKVLSDFKLLQASLKSGNLGNVTGDLGNSIRKLAAFQKWQDSFMGDRIADFSQISRNLSQSGYKFGSMIDNLLEDAKKLMMFPFSSIMGSYPKMVRDLSRELGKKVDLQVEGAEIEIDRRILEQMKEPLLHLLRNSVDHGIGKPKERAAQGKAETGTIQVHITLLDQNVELVISDDGGGINRKRMARQVISQGLAAQPAVDAMDDRELFSFMFRSGFSTSAIVSELSGRGVGMAIVREKIEKLNGTIEIDSQEGKGTSFKIVLPLTVATFSGIFVTVRGDRYILPTFYVERAIRIKRTEIRTVENKEVINLEGKDAALVNLANVLEYGLIDESQDDNSMIDVLVLHAQGKRIAFSVDQIGSEMEVFFKHLGLQLSRVRNIAGATILGNGDAVPILNIMDLMKSAISSSSASRAVQVHTGGESGEEFFRILIVDDSITTRTLIKNILESAGHQVAAAVDGKDAFTQLQTDSFDIVVSDVKMPRMDGFELTEQIRASREFASLPVILVTAQSSRDDRERGIEVGANAYIVKSNFEQSNLLETISKLVVRDS